MNEEEYKKRIDEVHRLIAGLFYFCKLKGVKTQELINNQEVLEEVDKAEAQINLADKLSVAETRLSALKSVVVKMGIPESEMTDSQLMNYARILELDAQEEVVNEASGRFSDGPKMH